MTLQEIITDLKTAGANDNTLRLAMNCYLMGEVNEREACAMLAVGAKIDFAPPNIDAVTAYNEALDRYAESIRLRGRAKH